MVKLSNGMIIAPDPYALFTRSTAQRDTHVIGLSSSACHDLYTSYLLDQQQ